MLRSISSFVFLSFFILSPGALYSSSNEDFELSNPKSPFHRVKLDSGQEEVALNHVKVIGAESVHKKGITGKGITIGIIDVAFDPSHPAYNRNILKISTEENAFIPRCFVTDYFMPFILPIVKVMPSIFIAKLFGKEQAALIVMEEFISHGALVTSIVKSVAPGAQMRVIGAMNHREFFDLRHESEAVHAPNDCLAAALGMIAQDENCRVLNLSLTLNLTTDTEPISEEVKRAMINVVESGKIIVKSVGNKGCFLGGDAYTKDLIEMARDPRMKGRLIFAGALNYSKEKEGGFIEELWDLSNRPGEAQGYYISAPGSLIYGAAYYDGGGIASGTSCAAPQVTGCLALLMEVAPGLEPEQYIELLTQSARKKSYMGNAELDRNLYGHGIVDAEAAIKLARERGWVKT